MSEALDRWSPTSRATASEMETVLLQQLRGHGLDPIVQFDVLDEFGNLVATTDLGLPKSLVTIDYDSMQEHSDEFQIARDNRRRNEIIAAGYKPLVARYNDVRSGARQLMDEIERASRRPAS